MEGNPREIESVVIVDSFVDQLAAKREPMQVLLSCLSSASFTLGRQEAAPRPPLFNSDCSRTNYTPSRTIHNTQKPSSNTQQLTALSTTIGSICDRQHQFYSTKLQAIVISFRSHTLSATTVYHAASSTLEPKTKETTSWV